MKNLNNYLLESLSLNSDLMYKEKKFWDNIIDSDSYDSKTHKLDIEDWIEKNQDVLDKYDISQNDLNKILQYEIENNFMKTTDKIYYTIL